MSSYLAAEQAASARLKRDTYLAKDLANAMVYLNKATVSCGVPATVISGKLSSLLQYCNEANWIC